jgi:hypothetical protein
MDFRIPVRGPPQLAIFSLSKALFAPLPDADATIAVTLEE